MTQSKAGDVISGENTGPSSITPHPSEPLAFAFGTPEVIQPLWTRMCESKSYSGLNLVGMQTQQDTLFQARDRSGEGPVSSPGDSGGCGSRTGVASVSPDPLQPLAISVGAHGAITDRSVVDEIIQRHSTAGLPNGRGMAGQLQAAYILGVSPQDIDVIGGSAAIAYSLLPPRVTKEPDINESQTANCPSRLRAKHAVDIQIAVVGSLLNRRPDLFWMLEALLGLSDGLAELDAGFSPPVLTRTLRSVDAGREDTYQRVVKSFAVLGWSALVRIGVKKGDADRLIGSQLTEGKFLAAKTHGPGAASTHTLLNWRKRYEQGDLPPLILPSRHFLELFPAGSKADPNRVVRLVREYLKGAKAIRDAGGGFRVLRPADLRNLRDSQQKPSPAPIKKFRRKP